MTKLLIITLFCMMHLSMILCFQVNELFDFMDRKKDHVIGEHRYLEQFKKIDNNNLHDYVENFKNLDFNNVHKITFEEFKNREKNIKKSSN